MTAYGPSFGGLYLNRKVGEELVIGEGENECVICVEAAAGGRVSLRITAGPSVRIDRSEIRKERNQDGK
jgi:sRNA-binding carbon storage regulator CsrA